jgi:MFS family permease
MIPKDLQLFKFSAYGFLKNLRFFEPFLLLYFLEQGLSFFEIGILISIREISTGILEIPTGIVADSYGRRNSMIFSFISYIVSFLIFYFFPSFTFYIVAMLFFAGGEAFRTGTHKAMILEYLTIKNIKHLKVEYYGYTRSWSQKGSAVSALLAGAVVIFAGSYQYIFLASVVPYIAELLLMISYPKELNGIINKHSHPNILKEIILNLKKTFMNFFATFKQPVLRKAVINSALFDGFFRAVKDYIQPVLKTFVLSVPFLPVYKEYRVTIIIAITYFILFLLTSSASKRAGKIAKKFSSLSGAVNITFVIGITIITLAGIFMHFNLTVFTVIFFVILYIIQNLRRPINIGFISENIPSEIMASGLSAESQLKTFFAAVLAPVIGFLADKCGIGIALIVISGLTILLFPFFKLKVNLKEKIL